MELIEKIVASFQTEWLTEDEKRALAQAALTALIEHAGGDGVTECDKIEAEAMYELFGLTGEQERQFAQAFARHRATAFAAGRAARDREIVEWLRNNRDYGDMTEEAVAQGREDGARAYIGGMMALRRAADAIEHGEV